MSVIKNLTKVLLTITDGRISFLLQRCSVTESDIKNPKEIYLRHRCIVMPLVINYCTG